MNARTSLLQLTQGYGQAPACDCETPCEVCTCQTKAQTPVIEA